MGGTNEHLRNEIVDAIVEQALQIPGELRTRDIPLVQHDAVRVDTVHRLMETNQHYYPAVGISLGVEAEQGMFVSTEFLPHLFCCQHMPIVGDIRGRTAERLPEEALL